MNSNKNGMNEMEWKNGIWKDSVHVLEGVHVISDSKTLLKCINIPEK